MRFSVSEERRLLQDSARKLLQARSPVAQLRRLRDSGSREGFDRELWTEVAALGWPGLLIPERHGGAELGYLAAGQVSEEIGRALAALPFLSTAVMAVTALVGGGTPEQHASVLPAVAAGRRLIALALEEHSRHAPLRIGTRAVPTHGGYRLSGRKIFVLEGPVADDLIVSARVSEGGSDGSSGPAGELALFLLGRTRPGVQVEPTALVDSRSAAIVRLQDVEVTEDERLRSPGDGAQLLEDTLDAGRALLAAELVGIARECLDRTVQYLCQREQFGRKIGGFQALQHRAAHLHCELELAASCATAALHALQHGSADCRMLVSVAKAKCGEVANLAASEAVQMHGGIGMTDELDVGLFVKRARCASEALGDAAFHRDRVARLHGY